jgi:hypothetical protein
MLFSVDPSIDRAAGLALGIRTSISATHLIGAFYFGITPAFALVSPISLGKCPIGQMSNWANIQTMRRDRGRFGQQIARNRLRFPGTRLVTHGRSPPSELIARCADVVNA